jgi:hypothetical protein
VLGLRTVALAKVYAYLGFPGLGSGRCGFGFCLAGRHLRWTGHLSHISNFDFGMLTSRISEPTVRPVRNRGLYHEEFILLQVHVRMP